MVHRNHAATRATNAVFLCIMFLKNVMGVLFLVSVSRGNIFYPRASGVSAINKKRE